MIGFRRSESCPHQGAGRSETGRNGGPELRDGPEQSTFDHQMDGGRGTGEKQYVHRRVRPAVQLDHEIQRVVRHPERAAFGDRHLSGVR